jgi:hypothetical protein
VWTHKFCNLNVTPTYGTFGLGDMLRGTIGALRYCEQRGYECIVDISLHPLSQLLLHKPHRFSQIIQDNKDNIKFLWNNNIINDLDSEFEEKDLIYFFSNFGLNIFDIPASETIKDRVRQLLTPNEYLASYLTQISTTIPRPFGVLHFRLGDRCVVLDEDISYSEYIDFIKKSDPTNMILMSDSAKLKELAKDIFSLEGPPAHVGFHTDAERLKHTMAEFFLLRESSVIFTYSIYGWTSGFVKLINYIYGVHLAKINI